MFKRFFLFFGVNILIVVMLSFILQLLGLNYYFVANGIDYSSLMIFCLIWGMGGAFISLFLSKWMAKKLMGVQILSPTGTHGELVRMVHALARKAGLTVMPEVGLYNSPELNAFATGPSKKNSLVAVSSGLLSRMNREQIEGVLAHEVAHIANGDMVTMTLLQGIINAFVMFFARIVAFFISQAMRDEEGRGGMSWIAERLTVILFEVVFGILGAIVVAWFSRVREFKADSGGASLAGNDKMILALRGLLNSYPSLESKNSPISALQISSKSRLGLLFSTHPSLEDRIRRLQRG